MIIGLAGRAGCGKNTVADIICEFMPGWKQTAFADPLREVARYAFGLTRSQLFERGSKERTIDEWGMSPREILQKLGTEVGRELHPDVWVRWVERHIEQYPDVPGWLVTDVRFPNELDWIDSQGGAVWWISRPDPRQVSGGGHSSEHALASYIDDMDVQIDNSGTIDHLRLQVWQHIFDL